MGGEVRAQGAFCCLQPRLVLLEEFQVGQSLLGRMSLVEPGVPLLRSGLCFHGARGMFKDKYTLVKICWCGDNRPRG